MTIKSSDVKRYKHYPFVWDDLEAEWAIPAPVGKWLIVQYPEVNFEKKSSGGIILVHDTIETESWKECEAVVVAIGDIAFLDSDGTPYANILREHLPLVGDIVRVPEWGNDNFHLGDDPQTHFAAFDPARIYGVARPIKERPSWEEYLKNYEFGRKRR